MLNPAATLLTQMGHAFIDGPHLPSAATAAARLRGWPIAADRAIIAAVFALGWWFFTREAPRVAENL